MNGPKWSRFNITSVTLGFAFLYLPIVLLVVYSFNASKLVTVWAGFSTKWYVALLSDQAMQDAAWVTLRVGLISATVATVLGTMAAIQDAGNAYGIWVDTDGCVAATEYCDLFLTTVEKHMDVAVYATVQSVLDGTFKGGLYVGTLENDGVGIADLNSAVPADVASKIDELKQGIIDGSVSVDPADYPG